MDPQKLVHMANQIGAFFEAEPDQAVAVEGVVGHLRRFWDPRMRRALYQWLDTQDGQGLSPMVTQALRARRDTLLSP
jgi:formate dehydrogenase subunit delta